MTQFKDPQRAKFAQDKLDAAEKMIEAQNYTTEQIVFIASTFAYTYTVSTRNENSPAEALAWYATLDNDEERRFYAVDALKWQMAAGGGVSSPGQRQLSADFMWA